MLHLYLCDSVCSTNNPNRSSCKRNFVLLKMAEKDFLNQSVSNSGTGSEETSRENQHQYIIEHFFNSIPEKPDSVHSEKEVKSDNETCSIFSVSEISSTPSTKKLWSLLTKINPSTVFLLYNRNRKKLHDIDLL